MPRHISALCSVCTIRFANDRTSDGRRVCRRCYQDIEGRRRRNMDHEAEIVARQREKAASWIRKPAYVPPSRDPVIARDPRTGQLVEFDIVFDGR